MNERRISVTLKLIDRNTTDPASNRPTFVGYRVRLVSEWLACNGSSGIFGKGEQDWKPLEVNGIEPTSKFSIYKTDFSIPDFATDKTLLQRFSCKPGVYAILCEDEKVAVGAEKSEQVTTPLAFTYIDCSSFLLRKDPILVQNIKLNNMELLGTFETTETFAPLAFLLPFEPLLLGINHLNNYPLLKGESPEEAIDSLFITGEILLDTNAPRRILCFPSSSSSGSSSEYNEEKAMRTDSCGSTSFLSSACFLPGLSSPLALCKDLLASTTFMLEVHRGSDVHSRAFHQRNVSEYHAMANKEAAEGAAASAGGKEKDAAKGKAAPPAKGVKGVVAIEAAAVTAFGEMKASDRFLMAAMEKSLSSSKMIRPHGAVRFRLEQLLSSSNDMLNHFAQRRDMRHKSGSTATQGDGEEGVVVSEDMLLECRLERPSKPEKWDLPADMSLKSTLLRMKAEDQSKLDGTLAARSSSPNAAASLSQPPRYELFTTCDTCVQLSASLYRRPIPLDELCRSPERHPHPPLSSSSASSSSSLFSPTSASSSTESAASSSSWRYFGTLEDKLAATPFTRMIVVFRYLDDDTLFALNDSITRINARALPNIQGTIRSYSLSPQELEQSRRGELDLISGFMILDDDMRIIVLEGLARLGCAMQHLFADLPRLKANDADLKILCNPSVLFPHRLYTEFSPDLRRIRVRDTLKKLAKKPEIYNRKQVDELCLDAIDGIMNLRRAVDMQSTKDLDLYPSAAALNKLELLYGEAISKTDIDGTARREFIANAVNIKLRSPRRNQATTDEPAGASPRNVSPRDPITALPPSGSSAVGGTSAARLREEYAQSDCRNPSFDSYLLSRPLHRINHVAENRSLRMQAYEDMLTKKTMRLEEYTKNITKVLEKEANAAKQQALDNKSKMLTKGGFMYPKRRSTKELITHDKRPTDARIEELAFPYLDKNDVVKAVTDPMQKSLEHGYKVMVKPESLFGSLQPVEFTREFQLKLVGDRSKLPRGTLKAGDRFDKDPNSFRSVHVKGEEAQRTLLEAQAKEIDDWKKKVVVDHIDFKMSGFKVRDKPLLLDRAADILKGEPKQKALQHLRKLTSHTGSDYSYKTTPVTIMNLEPYEANAAKFALVRRTDKNKFITTAELKLRDVKGPADDEDEDEEKKVFGDDFNRYISSSYGQPSDAVVRSKPPATYDPTGMRLAYDKTGPRWDPAVPSSRK